MQRHSLLVALVATLVVACGSSADDVATPDTDSGCNGTCDDATLDGSPDGDPLDTGPIDTGDPHARELLSVEVQPHDPVLQSTDGSQPTQAFTVVGHRRDGTTTMPLTGLWSLSTPTTGMIDQNTGTFTANGTLGGAVRVRVEVAVPGGMALRAETSVSVNVMRNVMVPGAPADAASHFSLNPPVVDPARAITPVYPLEGAVMPQNVYPADIQWPVTGTGVAGDIYRVVLHKDNFTATAYVLHTGASFNYDWLADAAAWHTFAQTDGDVPGTVTIDRWDSARNEVVAGVPRTIRFANAAISGSVYYWDIAAGLSIRIDDGTANQVRYMPSPPAGVDGARCVGCHAISPDGRYFAGRLGGGDNIGAMFDLTVDLTGNPPPTIYPVNGNSTRWWFSSFNPDATRLVITTSPLTMAIMDPHTGRVLPTTGTPLPGANSVMPSWSPDGNSIAYVANANDWTADSAGDIGVVPVTGADQFGPARVIHHGNSLASATPAGNCDSYPSWTPDSQWIAFAHGNDSRSDSGNDALYFMAADGSGVVRLDHANGGPGTSNTYQPHFSPFNAGGYFWVAFLSRRAYGNTRRGTNNNQQIWVAAISNHPTPGQDPSEVAYWLPGQATTSANIAAYWAPRACRRNAEDCTVGTECCSGICASDGMGHMTCQPPPMNMCHTRGQGCGGDGDCCEGLYCAANVCDLPPG